MAATVITDVKEGESKMNKNFNFNETVEGFTESLVKVTVLASNKADNSESSAVEIGKPEDYDTLREKAYHRVLGYIGCECVEAPKADIPKALPKVFEEPEDEPEEELVIPGQIRLEEIEAENEEEAKEIALEKAAEIVSGKAEAEEEDEDPFSFLDDAFNEAEEAEAEAETEKEPEPEPVEEPVEEPAEEPEPAPEPAPAPKKRGRPRKVDAAAAEGMTREKALATIVAVSDNDDVVTDQYRKLAGMTMGELLEKKPKMAQIMIRDHVRPQLSAETIKAAEYLAK